MAADETAGGFASTFGSEKRKGGGGGGSGTITQVESLDGSILVTNPTGPVVDLKANAFVGSSWLSTQLTRAQKMLARLDSPLFFTDFPYNPGDAVGGISIEYSYATLFGGTASQSPGFPSGVIATDCGPNANAYAYVYAAPTNPFPLVVNPSGTPFYACSRVRIQGTPSLQGQRFLVGMFEDVLDDYVIMGEFNGVLNLQTKRNGGGNPSANGGVADFSNAHDYAVGFDGTTIRGYVDGVAVPGLAITDLSGLPVAQILLGSGALVNTGGGTTPSLIDKLAYIVPSLA